MNSVIRLSSTDSRLFSAETASALGDINAAVIVQQLHYWMGKEEVGTIINGIKYIYNSFNDWVKQFPWLSVWQFRKAMKLLRDLEIVEVIRYKSKQWNQTNYYTLNSDRLYKILKLEIDQADEFSTKTKKEKKAESIENSDLWDTADREVRNQQIEVRDSALSYIDTKKTIQRGTAEIENESSRRSPLSEKKVAAVSSKTNLKEENNTKEGIHHTRELNVSAGQYRRKSEDNQTVTTEQESSASRSTKEINKINTQWKEQIEELDSLRVQINKTLIGLVKIYSEEEVKDAIALLKYRKKEKFIPNMAGYFTAALKGGWSCEVIANTDDKDGEVIDKVSTFRLWYELAKKLGYCSGQEIREGEQWVLLSGNWEKWNLACDRGYSLDYLKKVMRRSKNN